MNSGSTRTKGRKVGIIALLALSAGPCFRCDGADPATSSPAVSEASVAIWRDLGETRTATLGVGFSADGRFLFVAGGGPVVRIWGESAYGRLIGSLTAPLDRPNVELYCASQLAASEDGSIVVTGSYGERAVGNPSEYSLSDHDAHVWDRLAGKEIMRLRGHGGQVRYVALSADGTVAATAGNDGTLRLWNTKKALELWRYGDRDDDKFRCVSLTADGRFVVACRGQELLLWEVAQGHIVYREQAATSPHDAKLDVHGDRVVWVGMDGSVRAIDVAAQRTIWELHSSVRLPLNRLALGKGGQYVAVAASSYDGKTPCAVLIGEVGGSEWLAQSPPIAEYVEGLAMSPNGELVAVGTRNNAALWDWAQSRKAAQTREVGSKQGRSLPLGTEKESQGSN